MPIYKGTSGQVYTLEDKPFASGGEGQIFHIKNLASPKLSGTQQSASALVAKIYHQNLRSQERKKKLTVMMNVPPSQSALNHFTWPMDVIYDERGLFCGYIMQRLTSNKRLNEFYSYDQRAGRPWSLYITLAMNLTAAVHGAHQRGHVCGDLNPNNICVNPQSGIVTLVDTDSYHIRDPKTGAVYRCEVATAEFVPPKLQGINFKTAPLPTFSVETDLFALAVLLFSLLMNGAHPFACAVSGAHSGSGFQPVVNIAKGFYPYDRNVKGVTIPKYAPEISALPVNIQEMFIAAFLTKPGKRRPTALEWHKAFEQLSVQLKTCTANVSHVYYNGIGHCPWCRVNSQMKGLVSSQPTRTQTTTRTQATTRTQTQTQAKTQSQPQPARTQPRPARTVATVTGRQFSWPSFSWPSFDWMPRLIVIIFTLAIGGGAALGVFLLLSRLNFMWGVIGGVIAAACGLFWSYCLGESFVEDPGILSFILAIIFSVGYTLYYTAIGLIGMFALILFGSIAIAIVQFIIGLFTR